MFAIIRTGGKQFKVQGNTVILVEKLNAEPGKEIELNDVLMLGDGADLVFGDPLVEGAHIVARVEEQIRDKKIIVFKKKRRKNYRRKKGHRQEKTVLRIVDIVLKGKSKVDKASITKDVAKKKTIPVVAAVKKVAEKPAEKKVAVKKDAPSATVKKATPAKKPAVKKTAAKSDDKK